MRHIVKASVFVVVLLVAAMSYAETLQVSAEKVYLRSRPTTASEIVGAVVKGEVLGVLEKEGYWNKVQVLMTGEIGYIHNAMVTVYRITDSAPAAARPPEFQVQTQSRPPRRPPSSSQPSSQVTQSRSKGGQEDAAPAQQKAENLPSATDMAKALNAVGWVHSEGASASIKSPRATIGEDGLPDFRPLLKETDIQALESLGVTPDQFDAGMKAFSYQPDYVDNVKRCLLARP